MHVFLTHYFSLVPSHCFFMSVYENRGTAIVMLRVQGCRLVEKERLFDFQHVPQ